MEKPNVGNGNLCSTLTGILAEYDSSIITTSKINAHFVLDIDNVNFFFLYQEETEFVKETLSLYKYIKNCVKSAEREPKKNYFNDGIQLYEAIKNLIVDLNIRAKKETSPNYNEKKEKASFLTLYEDESEIECFEENLRIQKAFFLFVMRIIQNFVSMLSIEGEKAENDINIRANIKKEDTEINIEKENKRKDAERAGRIFKKQFKECFKYSYFFINFCIYHDVIDLYKIPYTFINEFIYYSQFAVRNDLSEVDVFKLIDQLYGKKEIAKKESQIDIQNIYAFNFINFVDYYNENLRKLINRGQEDDEEIFTKLNTITFKTYKRNGFYLSNKILNLYMNFSNNNFGNLLEIFSLIKCVENVNNDENKINENEIEDKRNILAEAKMNNYMNKFKRDIKIFGSYSFVEITNIVEKGFILKRCFSSFELIKLSLLNILVITRGFTNQKISNLKVIETICNFCEKTKALSRKYMNIFLIILHKLNLNNSVKNKNEIFKCRNIIAKYFIKSNTLPTEEATLVLHKLKKDKDIYAKEEKNIKTDLDIEKNNEEEKFIKEKGKFFDDKLIKNVKKFDIKEILIIIDEIFEGNYPKKSKLIL